MDTMAMAVGAELDVVRYGDDRARPVRVVWAGEADTWGADGWDATVPCILAADDAGRDMVACLHPGYGWVDAYCDVYLRSVLSDDAGAEMLDAAA